MTTDFTCKVLIVYFRYILSSLYRDSKSNPTLHASITQLNQLQSSPHNPNRNLTHTPPASAPTHRSHAHRVISNTSSSPGSSLRCSSTVTTSRRPSPVGAGAVAVCCQMWCSAGRCRSCRVTFDLPNCKGKMRVRNKARLAKETQTHLKNASI